ncbi:alpha-galactosidase [Mucilaginibacter pineti]|uniref:Alpha-galactosidase n=1 Tax=Mucilaginibacter pineti TaxID=1391627 RepID=A0A1G6X2F1_9SPHI|nr:NPCBM/NEW2 domain-containing protein [Mucilaginibacter pineti]SDD72224.1 alpha-galactosidase [Mucilaginibacter pineti]
MICTTKSYQRFKSAKGNFALMLGLVAMASGGLSLPAFAQDASVLKAEKAGPDMQWVDSMDLSQIEQGWGQAKARRSVGDNPITLAGVVYPHGVGSHAASTITIALKGAATHFASMVGIDDETGKKGSVIFIVKADGKQLAKTPVLHVGDSPQLISVDVTGAKQLTLEVDDAGDGITEDHGDWAGAILTLKKGSTVKPSIFTVPSAPPRIVLQQVSVVPQIHGARVVGATPGHPFLFLIAATGKGPLSYSAKGLPAGLTLNKENGVISGSLSSAGSTNVLLTVTGSKGVAKRQLTIVGGENKLSLTPPMGWNSWNVWAGKVDKKKVEDAADQMIASGLAAHGYSYINVDDTWEAGRDDQGNILSNEKFPDMPGLSAYIHDKGLKFGIYSSPGPKTCADFTGSYQHDDKDAATYAAWGVDYLKYDWCSYGEIVKDDHSIAADMKPYQIMGSALGKVNRDILYSLCQYGMGDVWKWGADPSINGNCWRTTGDITDNWGSLKSIFESQPGHEKYAGPGHWNDPDMLMVGIVGFGNTHPTGLKPNEQILHVSMWSLLAAPLLIGCDMTKLDPFTLALLANDEMIDIDQDPLGKGASLIIKKDGKQVWVRPLFDGTKAVGLVNTGSAPQTVTVKWADLGIKGAQPVRDIWLHKNVGTLKGSYSVEVPAHGCVMLKIGTAKKV